MVTEQTSTESATATPRTSRPTASDETTRIRVAVVGATGYAGGELVRLLSRHPSVEVIGLTARGREREPLAATHAHLAATGHVVDAAVPEADAFFLALPHGTSSAAVPSLIASGATVVDLGPDFRLHEAAAYPRWYGFEHPAPELLAESVYGLPEVHRDELAAVRDRAGTVVASPGCYPTAAVLAVAPLARQGLIDDLVIDAKSGISGAGREVKPELMFSEANENVRAYGLCGHRHIPEIEQELGAFGGGDASPVTFIPHLVPMTRGILATAYVRPTLWLAQRELDELYEDAYSAEPFVHVVTEPPSTKHVLGSNDCRVHVRADDRTGRIVAIAVIDNLVKGAAGQAIQAFNLVHGLPEDAGLRQLPLAP